MHGNSNAQQKKHITSTPSNAHKCAGLATQAACMGVSKKHGFTMNRFSGTVKKLRPVTRNRVQIEFEELNSVFELFIDQSWAIEKGDKLTLAGFKDDTGKVFCLAYMNHNKNVSGWNYLESNFMAKILLGVSIVFLIVGVTASFYGVAIISGVSSFLLHAYIKAIKNKNSGYIKAKSMVGAC